MISTITKRDGRKTEFNKEKIAQAIFKAAYKMGGHDYALSERLADQVVDYLENENLNEDETRLLENSASRILEVIKRDDRLDKIEYALIYAK